MTAAVNAGQDREALREAIAFYQCRQQHEGLAAVEVTMLAAAKAHLETLPKTKMVEVWHVEWADGSIPHIDDPYLCKDMADRGARLRREEKRGSCIRVTGPHKQEVPA